MTEDRDVEMCKSFNLKKRAIRAAYSGHSTQYSPLVLLERQPRIRTVVCKRWNQNECVKTSGVYVETRAAGACCHVITVYIRSSAVSDERSLPIQFPSSYYDARILRERANDVDRRRLVQLRHANGAGVDDRVSAE